MDFFDKVGEVASQTYRNTAKQVEKFTKETKLKFKMNENKARIEELYKEIGAATYRIHISRKNDNAQEEIDIACNDIDKISVEIEKENEELLKIRGKKECRNCHEEIDRDSRYCPTCGAEQNEKNSFNMDDEVIENVVEEDMNNTIKDEEVKEKETKDDNKE